MIRVNVRVCPLVHTLTRVRFSSSHTNLVHRVAKRALSTHIPSLTENSADQPNTSRDLCTAEEQTMSGGKTDTIRPKNIALEADDELIQKIIDKRQLQPKRHSLIKNAKIGAPLSGFVDDIFLEVAASKGNLLAIRELERTQRDQ